MADAKQRHLRLISKQLHELYLALGVESGCGLVKDDDVRLVKQDAGKSYPLFLAAGERLVPGRLFLQLVGKVLQADTLEHFGNFLNALAVGCVRIGCCAPERSNGDVGSLGE